MSIHRLGFCGIDDEVNHEDIISLTKTCAIIEWGVLFHPRLSGTARYPSMDWVQKTTTILHRAQPNIHLAAHICGGYVMDLLNAKKTILDTIINEFRFKRIQINPTKANDVIITDYNIAATNLLSVIAGYPKTEFIIQRNHETLKLCSLIETTELKNVSFLYDASCGFGIYDIHLIEKKNTTKKYGFAGGINPENIGEVLNKIKESQLPTNIWIDMETGIRTINHFDMKKCKLCVMNGNLRNSAL